MTQSYDDLYWNSDDGLRLHARDHAPAVGQTPRGTVVCIPGLTRNAADFDALARTLTGVGWRVLAVDLRGRAGSARAPDPTSYNPRTYADDMVALLRSQNIAKAVFIGTSLGVLPMKPGSTVEVVIEPGLFADCDPHLAQIALENLLGNAWKYSRNTPQPRIHFGLVPSSEAVAPTFFVRDNGAGFDMSRSDRLFKPFTRLHQPSEFQGSGIGLATVYRIIERHGGQIQGEGEVGKGAVFRFTFGRTLQD